MRQLLNRYRRDRKGGAAIEMALIAPILVTMLAGMIELGWVFYQSAALERGLRAGATYAARSEVPMSSATKTAVGNLIKTASMDGGLGTVATNWDETGAAYTINVVNRDVGSITVPVIRLQATVPFSPVSSALMDLLGVGSSNIVVTHEQAFIAI